MARRLLRFDEIFVVVFHPWAGIGNMKSNAHTLQIVHDRTINTEYELHGTLGPTVHV